MADLLGFEAARLKADKAARGQRRVVPLPVVDPPAVPDDELLALIRQEAGNRPWIWIPVTPMGAVRQVKKDDWNPSSKVARYRAWRDRVRPYLRQIEVPEDGAYWIFLLPIPQSWWEAKKRRAAWAAHQQKPDKNNLEKAVEDAALQEDCRLWRGGCEKRWWWHGGIILLHPAGEG